MNGANGCLFAVICIVAGIVAIFVLAPGLMILTEVVCDSGKFLALFATVAFVIFCIGLGIKNIGK